MNFDHTNIFKKAASNKAAILCAVLITAQIAGAEVAFAASSGSAFSPLQSALQMIVDFINGPFGRLAAIVAVMALGLAAFAGRLSWITAGAVILGMGLVFGAPTIVDQLMASVK